MLATNNGKVWKSPQNLEADSRHSEPLSGPCEGYCENRATGPATEAEYRDRLKGSRRLGYCLIAFALGMYAAWAFFSGLIS